MNDIKFCENNFDYDIESLIERIDDELEDVDVQVEPCLGECGICSEGPFAIVNGEVLKADTAEDLFDIIKEKIG
jgi:Uncharacterized protein conserved in bacteria